MIWSSLVAIVASGGWLLSRNRQDILAWIVEPGWLSGLIALSLIVFVVRASIAVDAARVAGLGRTPHRWLSRLGLAAVVILLAVPHVAAALLVWQQRQLVTRVFTAHDTPTARPTDITGAGPIQLVDLTDSSAEPADGVDPATEEEAKPTISSRAVPRLSNHLSSHPVDHGVELVAKESSRPMISSQAVPRLPSDPVDDIDSQAGPLPPPDPADDPRTSDTVPAPPPVSSVQPDPSLPEGPISWDGDEQLSIVMLGSDGGYDRTGIRTDTIIVLTIDVATGDAVTFSVPRNWKNVPFPAGTPAAAAYPGGNPDLANTVYGLGLRRPDLFAGSDHPGGAAIKDAMAQTLGLPIHYFVMVDMTAVVEAVDLFGGIDLTVSEYINDRIRPIEKGGPALDITVDPGRYHFDGLTTLAYVRSRVQSWDYSRMARQRCVVGALIDQVGPLEVMVKFGSFTDIVTDHVVTDIPLERADELLAIAARIDPDRMQSVNFVPPEFPSGHVPLTRVRNAVADTLSTDVSIDPVRSLTAACGP